MAEALSGAGPCRMVSLLLAGVAFMDMLYSTRASRAHTVSWKGPVPASGSETVPIGFREGRGMVPKRARNDPDTAQSPFCNGSRTVPGRFHNGRRQGHLPGRGRMPLETLLTPLKERLAEVHHLRVAEAVLGWDEQTYMPPEGATARARV